MILLLHGDDIETSRGELVRLKQPLPEREIRLLDGKNLDAAALTQALESASLFGQKPTVVIENLFSKLGKRTKLLTDYTAILDRSGARSEIILWEEKEVSSSVMGLLGSNLRAKLYKIPSSLFQFLDSLRPNNARESLRLYHEVLNHNAPEQVLTMLVRRMRLLIMVSDGTVPAALQPWQTARLTSQARLFTMKKLLPMYAALLQLEYSLKTGAAALALSQGLESYFIDWL